MTALVKRALVCEDDAAIRTLVTRVVQREGFSVDAVVDGAEALDKIGSDGYDLIIIDLMMPRVSGMEVLRHLREERPAHLKHAIVMTAAADAVAAFIEPICTFLPKPFDINRLRNVVRDCTRDAGA